MQDTRRTLSERYELGPTIGEGGMGLVHRGFDHALGRPVAVKVLTGPNDRDDAFVERFRREARSAARISHPNVVAVFDTGSDGGTEFIVTELVEGETLRDVLRRDGPVDVGRAVDIARGVCRALEAAHALGVVHRDIKPGNVMLTEGGVKVLDFGIARAAEGESLTRTGVLFGSAPYVSPEQAGGAPGDERSDLYALGCVLFEMLTGRPPFVGANPIAVLYQHVNEPPPSLAEIAAVPAGLERVVSRLLAKEPADRFASASEVDAALRDAAEDDDTVPIRSLEGLPTRPLGPDTLPMPMPRVSGEADTRAGTEAARRWPVLLGATVLVLLVGAMAFATSQRGDGPTLEGEGMSDVAGAYDHLVRSIPDTRSDGGVTGAAAAELEERASEIRRAFRVGDAKAVAGGIDGFARTLVRMIGSGSVSFDGSAAIADAFERFVAALDAAPPPSTPPVESPSIASPAPAVDGGEEQDQPGGGGGQHGPPAHSNAGGNGTGKGQD